MAGRKTSRPDDETEAAAIAAAPPVDAGPERVEEPERLEEAEILDTPDPAPSATDTDLPETRIEAGAQPEPAAEPEPAPLMFEAPENPLPPPPQETRAPGKAPEHEMKEPAAPPAPVRRSPLWPVLGGVVAAGLGFGLAQVVPQGWPLAGIEGLESRVAAQDARLGSLSSELAAAQSAIAALPEPADISMPDLEPLADRLASVEGRLANLPAPPADPSARLDRIEARLTVLEELPPPSEGQNGADPAALLALQRDLAGLRDELEAQKAAQAQIAADMAEAAAAARLALAEAETEAARLRAEAEASARDALTRAAMGRVLAALDSGAPLAAPLDELVAGGQTVPEELLAAAEGVPTLAELRASFEEPARAALDASLRADESGDITDRLGNFLRSATGVRSLTPREGDDPDAILSRAEAAVAAGDIPAALTEISALPEPGQAAMSAWVAQAEMRLRATEAAAALAAAVEG